MELNLKKIIESYQNTGRAIGHFNVSDLTAVFAIADSARELGVPVIIGVSEGERAAVGVRQIAAIIKSIREQYHLPIFLNADHTHSLEAAQAAAQAGFDAVIFDAGKLPLDENIRETKKAVSVLRSMNSNLVIEGEMGYIGSSSQMLKEIPDGAQIRSEDLTRAEDAKRFIEETGVDLLAPAVGNLHGMLINSPNPRLDIGRISEIGIATHAPLVLHGGSGILDEDFRAAIKAGISIVHINTEIRKAWREGVLGVLGANPEEIVPYKILAGAYEPIKTIVSQRLRLFSTP